MNYANANLSTVEKLSALWIILLFIVVPCIGQLGFRWWLWYDRIGGVACSAKWATGPCSHQAQLIPLWLIVQNNTNRIVVHVSRLFFLFSCLSFSFLSVTSGLLFCILFMFMVCCENYLARRFIIEWGRITVETQWNELERRHTIDSFSDHVH